MPKSAATSSPQSTTVAAMLSVRHGARAVDFYKKALGATELFRMDGENGSVLAQLAVGKCDFWVSDESPEHMNFSPESLGGGTVRMILVAANPDALFNQAIAAGAISISPMNDQPYGWRVGRVVDPFGHHWEIGKPLQ